MISAWSFSSSEDTYSGLSSTSTVADLTSTRSISSVESHSPIQDLSGDYEEADEDNDFVGDFEIVGKPSRKRRRKRGFQANNVLFTVADDGKVTPRLIIPHVIKSDARLTYANMVAAVYNSCDFDFMVRFMKTYFRSDFTVMQELSGKFPEGIKGKYEIYGLEVNCQYWYERMLDYPDVVFTLKDVKVQINADEDGQILVDFTLAGSVYVNAQEPEVQARVVIEDDPDKPVYVLGDYEGVLHSSSPPVAGSKLEKSEDFDHIFDDPGSDSEVGVEGRPTVVIDLGISATPDAASLLANEELLGDSNMALLDSLPNKHPRAFSANTGTDAMRQNSTRGTVQLPSGSSDPATIDQQINSNRLVKMNQPPADAAPVAHHYCYRGKMRMHFDTDSRVFLNEFFLFAD